MLNKPFLGIVAREDQVLRLVRDLLEAEFFMQDISVMVLEASREGRIPAAVSMAAGVLGGAFGLFEGMETLFLPGLGVLMGTGRLPALFLEAAPQEAEKGFVAILTSWGITEEEGAWLEEKVKEGQVLVAVDADGQEEWDRVREIFRKSGGLMNAAPAKLAA